MKILGVQLASTSPIISDSQMWVYLDSFIKIVDSQSMVAHVLVNDTPGNIYRLVLGHLDQHFTEAFESFLELIGLVKH